MLFVGWMLKDLLNCWQLLGQDSLKLPLPTFSFANKYTRIPKIILSQVIRTQVQVFIAADTDNACKIVQSRGSFTAGIFAFIHCFCATRPFIMGDHTNWLLDILQWNV